MRSKISGSVRLSSSTPHLRCRYQNEPIVAPASTQNSFQRMRHGRFENAASKACSSAALVPRIWSTTLLPQSKYSCFLFNDHPLGGSPTISLRLQILSASLTSRARGERHGACSIWSCLRFSLGRLLLSDSSAT